ncbi:O-methyltransferase [Quillaja saponaria]|uniref:isoflavone 7-O-methyltransferase n=1 Tax=Quillaja saponaria TaxID=32244 RepID=A0AAD7P9F3_QUISA|nr:O-methyltransferase [Quillaja saponaria]KAJ7947038.1 O-methyltransferase [Quillaja saponaria]
MDLIQENEASEIFQAQTHLYKHMFNFISSMTLRCAVQLGIPDIIDNHGQPITLRELVLALQVDQTKTSHLQRLMRLLVHNGFFGITKVHDDSREEKEAYVLTPPSKLLLKSKVPCLSSVIVGTLGQRPLSPHNSLRDWFYGKELTPYETALGIGFWDLFSQKPEVRNVFNETMENDSQMITLALHDLKPIFNGLGSIVDVGGGSGTLGRIISEAFSQLKCIVFDLPHVVANLQGSEKLTYVGGDMFQSIPPADAVILKWILHDWGDEDCIKILQKCREAILSKCVGGKVIIIDIVINENEDGHELTELKLFYDIQMMAQVNGKERNEKEWEKLFLEAGFRHYKITPNIFGFRSLIEVYP